MFIMANPGKKGKGRKKGKASRRAKRKVPPGLTPYQKFAKTQRRRHKGITNRQIADKWHSSHISSRYTTLRRARRSAQRAIAHTVCSPSKLKAVMRRYCNISTKSRYRGAAWPKRKLTGAAAAAVAKARAGVPKLLKAAKKAISRKRSLSGKTVSSGYGSYAPGYPGLGAGSFTGLPGIRAPKIAKVKPRKLSKSEKAWKEVQDKGGFTGTLDLGEMGPNVGIGPSGETRFNPFRRGTHMRKRKFHYRPRRRNLGEIMQDVMTPPTASELLVGVKPKSYVALLPVLGGAIANNLVRGKLLPSLKLPFISKGLGNYLAGVATSSLIGAIGGYFNYGVGQSMFVGGIGETALAAYTDAKENGITSPFMPRLSGCEGIGCDGYPDTFNMGEDLEGMEDFAFPQQVQSAQVLPSSAGGYPMPAQAMVAQAPAAPGVADYEDSVLSEMIEGV